MLCHGSNTNPQSILPVETLPQTTKIQKLMYIICFPGGLAGDLVTATIDSKKSFISTKGKIILDIKRNSLKTAFFTEPNLFLSEIFTQYKSVSSHRMYADTNYKTISIGVKDKNLYLYAAERSWILNPPNSAYKFFGVTNTKDLAVILKTHNEEMVKVANHVIYFDDIIEGNLIEKLQEFTTDLDGSLYQKWLKHWGNR